MNTFENEDAASENNPNPAASQFDAVGSPSMTPECFGNSLKSDDFRWSQDDMLVCWIALQFQYEAEIWKPGIWDSSLIGIAPSDSLDFEQVAKLQHRIDETDSPEDLSVNCFLNVYGAIEVGLACEIFAEAEIEKALSTRRKCQKFLEYLKSKNANDPLLSSKLESFGLQNGDDAKSILDDIYELTGLMA